MNIRITKKQLSVWNRLYLKVDGITFNEEYNKSIGLPGVEVRRFLLKLLSEKYGILGNQLSWDDIPAENRV